MTPPLPENHLDVAGDLQSRLDKMTAMWSRQDDRATYAVTVLSVISSGDGSQAKVRAKDALEVLKITSTAEARRGWHYRPLTEDDPDGGYWVFIGHHGAEAMVTAEAMAQLAPLAAANEDARRARELLAELLDLLQRGDEPQPRQRESMAAAKAYLRKLPLDKG